MADNDDIMRLIQSLLSGGIGGGDNGDTESTDDSGEYFNKRESGGEAADKPDNSDNTDSSDSSAGNPFAGIDLDMIFKLGGLMSQMNKPDKNSALLTALKPHLRSENRAKVDEAIKIMRLLSLLPILQDGGFLGGKH